MFENTKMQSIEVRKRKAILYAGAITVIIALGYLFIIRNDIYKFGGVKEDIRPLSNFIGKVSQDIGTSIKTGKEIIDNKNN